MKTEQAMIKPSEAPISTSRRRTLARIALAASAVYAAPALLQLLDLWFNASEVQRQ